MVYTNDCIAGISATNAGLRCIANPQPNNGFNYITYDRSRATTPTSTTCSIRAARRQPDLRHRRHTANAVTTSTRSHDNTARNWTAGELSRGGRWRHLDHVHARPTRASCRTRRADAAPDLDQARLGLRRQHHRRRQGSSSVVQRRPATHFNDLLALLAQRDQLRHRRDQELRLLHAARRHAEHRQGLLPAAAAPKPIRRAASATSSSSPPTATRPAEEDGNQYSPTEWINTYNAGTASGPTARRIATSSTELTALRTDASAATSTTSRPTSSAWATRWPTRARSPRSTRWPNSAAATRRRLPRQQP